MSQQGTNAVQCPKCEEGGNYLVTVKNGKQFLCCKHCGQVFNAEVKNGQFTGKVAQ